MRMDYYSDCYDAADHRNYRMDLPSCYPPYCFPPSSYSPYYSFTSCEYYPPQFTTAYSASTFGGNPGSVLIDPARDSTRFIVSYSNSDFNEPEFEEYDPTPYAGGYDPSLVYGEALAPSDEICYPRSSAAKSVPIVQVPLANTETTIEDDRKGREATGVKEESTPDSTGDDSLERESPVGVAEGPCYPSPAIPGCGLDALDICDGIFGYWPCLDREMDKRSRGGNRIPETGDQGYWAGTEEWQVRAADYLFGSSDPYDVCTRYGSDS